MTANARSAQFGLIILIALVAWPHSAKAVDYDEYKRSRAKRTLFEISFDKDEITIAGGDDNRGLSAKLSREDIVVTPSGVSAAGQPLFDEKELFLEDERIDYKLTTETQVFSDDSRITILFLVDEGPGSRPQRMRRGNRVTLSDPITVDDEQFVRGIALSIGGDIEVYGEVNGDVISLFGNVYIGPGAVARGDITTITGRADMARDASVYGEVYTLDHRGKKYRHGQFHLRHSADMSGKFYYNRVDGATPFLSMSYTDSDSLYPNLFAEAGYAFESGRWRYQLGLEQALWRTIPVAIGGKVYRRLPSDDDWILDDGENTIFALIATEDFKDYYEAEGAEIFLKIRPVNQFLLTTGFRSEETNWLAANRNLWSMFGGSKRFRPNFSSVDATFRDSTGIYEIDSTETATFFARLDWNTKDSNQLESSSWHFTADFEWSDNSFESDFDYRRYSFALRRHQKITRRTMLLLRGMLALSDGYLPMHKRYFLGGLGTLRGYNHKELMGTRFWMANVEYRFDLPTADFALSALWDVARIANDSPIDEGQIKHSFGFAAYVDDDLRISLAKRLDRSDNDDPKLYVRLEQTF